MKCVGFSALSECAFLLLLFLYFLLGVCSCGLCVCVRLGCFSKGCVGFSVRSGCAFLLFCVWGVFLWVVCVCVCV